MVKRSSKSSPAHPLLTLLVENVCKVEDCALQLALFERIAKLGRRRRDCGTGRGNPNPLCKRANGKRTAHPEVANDTVDNKRCSPRASASASARRSSSAPPSSICDGSNWYSREGVGDRGRVSINGREVSARQTLVAKCGTLTVSRQAHMRLTLRIAQMDS